MHLHLHTFTCCIQIHIYRVEEGGRGTKKKHVRIGQVLAFLDDAPLDIEPLVRGARNDGFKSHDAPVQCACVWSSCACVCWRVSFARVFTRLRPRALRTPSMYIHTQRERERATHRDTQTQTQNTDTQTHTYLKVYSHTHIHAHMCTHDTRTYEQTPKKAHALSHKHEPEAHEIVSHVVLAVAHEREFHAGVVPAVFHNSEEVRHHLHRKRTHSTEVSEHILQSEVRHHLRPHLHSKRTHSIGAREHILQ